MERWCLAEKDPKASVFLGGVAGKGRSGHGGQVDIVVCSEVGMGSPGDRLGPG